MKASTKNARALADRFIRWGRKHPRLADRIGNMVRRVVDWIDKRTSSVRS